VQRPRRRGEGRVRAEVARHEHGGLGLTRPEGHGTAGGRAGTGAASRICTGSHVPDCGHPGLSRSGRGGQKGPPTAKCKDGSLSYAQHHTGACSNHGGVAEWLDGTQK
jgi:hypothetical protein